MKEYQKEYQKEYRKTMTDEQKQRYEEARNKRDKDKYRKKKEYQKERRKNMTDKQKQRYNENRNKRNKDITDKEYKKESNNDKIIITIIKDNDYFNDIIKLQKSINRIKFSSDQIQIKFRSSTLIAS